MCQAFHTQGLHTQDNKKRTHGASPAMFLLHPGTGPTVLIRKSRTLSLNAEQDLSLLNQALSIVLYSRGSNYFY
jgi:hypothetical protein